MQDQTENVRRTMVHEFNNEVLSNQPDNERKRLEEKHGQIWDTGELQKDFEVLSFMAPFAIVTRKSDGSKGSLKFQHHPRFYFGFMQA